MGRIALDTEEFLEACEYFERALALFRILGTGAAWATLRLGSTAIYEGRFRSARKSLQKSLAAFRAAGTKNGLAEALCELARLTRLLGEHDEARLFLSESFALVKQIDSKSLAVRVLEQFAYLLKGENRPEDCAHVLGIARTEEMSSPVRRATGRVHRSNDAVRTALGDETFTLIQRRLDFFPKLLAELTREAGRLPVHRGSQKDSNGTLFAGRSPSSADKFHDAHKRFASRCGEYSMDGVEPVASRMSNGFLSSVGCSSPPARSARQPNMYRLVRIRNRIEGPIRSHTRS